MLRAFNCRNSIIDPDNTVKTKFELCLLNYFESNKPIHFDEFVCDSSSLETVNFIWICILMNNSVKLNSEIRDCPIV